jgi:ABC-2 type transport system ATP-binding protein
MLPASALFSDGPGNSRIFFNFFMRFSHSEPGKRSTAMQLIIDTLSKQYRRDFWGLRNFSLTLGPCVLGLLGPNGAGKSTLMRMLATITRPSAGAISWNGTDVIQSPDTLRAVLGYLPQDFGVYPNLNAVEFLEYMAAIKGLDGKTARRRIDELLQVVNLVEAARRPLGGYSGGMKQRVGIAQALLNDPQLLIVDEPTVGLDPEERVRFRNLLADLSANRIILLSTHIVSDVEAIATDIVIINKGTLLHHAAPEDLLQSLEGKVWQWIVPSAELPAIKQRYVLSGTIRRAEGVQVRVVSNQPPAAEAEVVAPSLEDVYLHEVSRQETLL